MASVSKAELHRAVIVPSKAPRRPSRRWRTGPPEAASCSRVGLRLGLQLLESASAEAASISPNPGRAGERGGRRWRRERDAFSESNASIGVLGLAGSFRSFRIGEFLAQHVGISPLASA